MKINLGCGETPVEGCINIDIQGHPCKPEVIADARQLPFPDLSVDWLECHQMLEHFDLDEGLKVMAEWQRIIKPGGHLLVTVPDLLSFLNGFVKEIGHLPEVWQGIVRYIYGGIGEYNRHLSAYSPPFLLYRLNIYGFACEVFSWPLRMTPSFAVLGVKR